MKISCGQGIEGQAVLGASEISGGRFQAHQTRHCEMECLCHSLVPPRACQGLRAFGASSFPN